VLFRSNTYSDYSDHAGWFRLQGLSTSLSTWLTAIDPAGSSAAPSYADPSRNMASYNSSLGGLASEDAFLAQARLQSKSNWQSAYTAQAAMSFIQRGFYRAGDANLDGAVTISDFITVAQNFGGTGHGWTTGDFNGDGLVSISDMMDLVSNWGIESSAQAAQVAKFAESMSIGEGTVTSPDLSADSAVDSTLNSSDAVDPNLNLDVLSQAEFSDSSPDNSFLKLLTGPGRKGIIRPVWFTYPRR